jgi:hypothetical protein
VFINQVQLKQQANKQLHSIKEEAAKIIKEINKSFIHYLKKQETKQSNTNK